MSRAADNRPVAWSEHGSARPQRPERQGPACRRGSWALPALFPPDRAVAAHRARPCAKTTEVTVILTVKEEVTRQQIMTVMPAEVRATVKLYLDGKIRQWYSRGDGRGVILVIDAKTVEEAHAVIDAMPLSKEDLVDHEYIPVGPLMPLAALIER